jgi:hypothetical protein
MTNRSRELTPGENEVLSMIQEMYGEQNTTDMVFFVEDPSEAVIFIKDKSGESVMMVNLTNLSAWRAVGSISSNEKLKTKWLSIGNT